jgi:hypothetical protein
MDREIREFLLKHGADDFSSPEDFAERLAKKIEAQKKAVWTEKQSFIAIDAITQEAYKYYRLTDATPFGKRSPIKLRLGGADKRSLKFFTKLDQFYFSKFADNHRKELKSFLQREYIEKGGAIFGAKSQKELDDFRKAAGAKLQNLTNRQVQTIIHTSVQRIRVWAHVGSLSQGEIKEAQVVAILDQRTTAICRSLNGTKLMVGVAQKTIERLNQLTPEAFGKKMYQSRVGRAINKHGADFFKRFVNKGVISDRLVRTGRGFPPYHPNCRTRLKALY